MTCGIMQPAHAMAAAVGDPAHLGVVFAEGLAAARPRRRFARSGFENPNTIAGCVEAVFAHSSVI
jgi:hypothetical protein